MQVEALVSPTSIPILTHRQLTLVNLTSSLCSSIMEALIDSGVDANFLDYSIANNLCPSIVTLKQPLNATAMVGRLLCTVTHCTSPVNLLFGDGH